jgi:glycosidase
MSWTNDAVNAGFSVSNTLFRSLSANATTNNVAAQIADNDSLYYFYQDLYRLRQAYPVLAKGVKQVLSTVNEPVLIWESVLNNERVVVALNLSADSVTSSVNQQLTDTSFSLVWSKEVSNESSTLSDNAGELTLTLSAYDVQVWQFAESTD